MDRQVMNTKIYDIRRKCGVTTCRISDTECDDLLMYLSVPFLLSFPLSVSRIHARQVYRPAPVYDARQAKLV